MERKLTRSNNRKIAGVCAGLAEYCNLDPTLIRVIWLILVCCYGAGILAYLICWAVIPNAE